MTKGSAAGMNNQREHVPESLIEIGDLIVGQWDSPARVVSRSSVTVNRSRPMERFVTDAGVMDVVPGTFITRILED